MAQGVTFPIKIQADGKGVGQATVNVKELSEAVNKIKENANKNPLKEWLQDVVGFEALVGVLQRISGTVGELTKTNGQFLANAEKPYHHL